MPGIRIAIFCIFFLSLAPQALAGQFFIDFGGGVAQIRKPQALFPGAPSKLSSGYGLGAALLYNFSTQLMIAQPQIGLHDRISSGTGSANTYDTEVLYPELRLQIWRGFIGAGVTPLVWASTDGVMGFHRATGAFGYIATAGWEFPIIPAFSLATAIDAEVIRSSGGLGPEPAVTALALFRFYFQPFPEIFGHDEGAERASYKGWRYPYGHAK